MFIVINSTDEARLAAAAAASHPASPAPTTMTLYFLNICYFSVPRGMIILLFYFSSFTYNFKLVLLKLTNVLFLFQQCSFLLRFLRLFFGAKHDPSLLIALRL